MGNVSHNYSNKKKHFFRNIVFQRSDVTKDQKKT